MNKTVLLVFVTFGAAAANCATIRVPSDQPTIQAGIDAASDGDSVLVAPGSYVENVGFKGKKITVLSADGPETTIIEPVSTSAPTVAFVGGEDTNTVLEGFTIRNGSRNIEINGNAAPRILDNRVLNGSDRGIFGVSSSGAIIQGNYFEGNNGAFKTGSGTYYVRENVVVNNHTDENGGGLFCYGCTNSELSYNIVARNSAAAFGGGIIISSGSGNRVINNTVYGNRAGTEDGGGVLVYMTSNCDVRNNIVAFNTSKYGIFQYSGSGNICEYNDVYGNIPDDYAGAE